METLTPLLAQVRALYDDGLYLQAYNTLGGSRSALANWRGTQERLYAGRMAANLGAHRLSNVLHTLAWRTDRTDPEARSAYARVLQEKHGPLYAWRWMQQIWNPLNPEITHTEWLATAAVMLGDMRDFERAHALLARALARQTDEYWVHTVHARVLEKEDRYPEAMEAVDRALDVKPWNRVGVQVKAHLLTLASRPEEAFALLTEAESRMESSAVTAQCAALLQERADWEGLEASVTRLEALAPIAEPVFVEWMSGLRGEVEYHRGQVEQARAYLEKSSGFDKKIAENLARERPARRVQLDVTFVRQNHVTCAPATLTALSRYWGRTAEHLDVVEEICYDGTPGHSERHWADTHGFVTREFTLSIAAAQVLLDRGVPLPSATTGLNMGHLQAVIGYDDRRGTLLIRDPYYPHTSEALAEELIESQRSTGPRAHAFVPIEKAELFDGIELPDAALWDAHHRLLQALQIHHREEAAAELTTLMENAPEHHLACSARRALASYDSDVEGILAAIESMLALYPDDPHLQVTRLSCLRDLSRPEERLEELKRLADDPLRPGGLLFCPAVHPRATHRCPPAPRGTEAVTADSPPHARCRRPSRRSDHMGNTPPLSPSAGVLPAGCLCGRQKRVLCPQLHRSSAGTGALYRSNSLSARSLSGTGCPLFFARSHSVPCPSRGRKACRGSGAADRGTAPPPG
ncbi:MAG: C39 family peptidase [Armatimonas sp.]